VLVPDWICDGEKRGDNDCWWGVDEGGAYLASQVEAAGLEGVGQESGCHGGRKVG